MDFERSLSKRHNNVMRLILSFIVLFISSASLADSVDSPYEDLRARLKPNHRPAERSHIGTGAMIPEEEPLSLDELTEDQKSNCRRNPRSPECLEYAKLLQPTTASEVCARDPLGKKCQKMTAREQRQMFKRQAICRPGLKSRKCMIARNTARRQGKFD